MKKFKGFTLIELMIVIFIIIILISIVLPSVMMNDKDEYFETPKSYQSSDYNYMEIN